ncbi:dolichol-phosphate mannosyltransferase [Spirochaetota bacterium]|nr:dolichol-phosphate mannosyltransferase [Spirochaetota bacterium]
MHTEQVYQKKAHPQKAYPDVGIVIPTYNEIANIKNLLETLLTIMPKATIMIVDDNSPDRTWEHVAAYSNRYKNIVLVKQQKKTGLGNAYKRGFTEILKYPIEKIVQLDADFSHPLTSIPKLVTLADQYDVIIGSRYKQGVSVINWELSRILISYAGNTFARLISQLPIHDLTSGFKCYRRDALAAISMSALRSQGYAFQIEMNVVLHKLGFTLYEHPIIFTNRQQGLSKLDTRILREAFLLSLTFPFYSTDKHKKKSAPKNNT